MNILLTTSWGRPFCGIQQHSTHLIAAVQAADPTMQITPSEAALDPAKAADYSAEGHEPYPDLLVLNYQRGLHSRWTPSSVETFKDQLRIPVVIIWHDSFGERPPDDLSQHLHDLADAFIVHEPCQGLVRAIYWRMGVPAFDGGVGQAIMRDLRCRPYLGTLGFNFGWKCWPTLAETAKAVGWGLLICTPELSEADEVRLRAKNPWLVVHRGLEHRDVIRTLHECDATAFTNVCGNSGQSAAILDGIAARKPVIALHTCRQYRALYQDPLANQAVMWAETFEEIQQQLSYMTLSRFDTGIVALAEQDSWANLGVKYADLFRRLVT